MKNIWKEIVMVAAIVIVTGGLCGFIGYVVGSEKIQPQPHEAPNSQNTIDM